MSDEGSQGNSLQGMTDAFLKDFFQKGEELVRELIEENERLRVHVGEGGTSEPSNKEKVTEQLMKRVGALEHECYEIRRLAGSVEKESGGYRERLENLESEHYHLASLFVSGLQFHTASGIEELLRTVTEVLLNFVGIGAFTIYAVDEEEAQLFPISREGGDYRERETLSLADPPFAALSALKRPWSASDSKSRTGNEIMNLPLYSGTRLMGVVTLEAFLSQKTDFVDNDLALLSLVSEHAGIGIESAWIRAHAKKVPLRRQVVEELVEA